MRIEIKIKNKSQLRKKLSDDYILGYYDAIAEMIHKLGLIKGAFDIQTYEGRILMNIKKSNKATTADPVGG